MLRLQDLIERFRYQGNSGVGSLTHVAARVKVVILPRHKLHPRQVVCHARSAVVFDVLARHLHHLGYDVTFVRNFTDVDDKIIRRANAEGVPSGEIATRYIEAFYEDMRLPGRGMSATSSRLKPGRVGPSSWGSSSCS